MNIPCDHRGSRIGTHTCRHCDHRGIEIIVYTCKLYGECTLVPWKHGQGEMVCEVCPDNTTALQKSGLPIPPEAGS
jgi:hypothetical protein